MSIDLVDKIHERLREEIDRLGLSLAAAARKAGEPSPQRLKDVVSGRQRCSAELVARMAAIDVDVCYVITGERTQRPPVCELASDELMLLECFRELTVKRRKALLAELLTGKKKASSTSIVVKGDGNRTAGGDYHE